MLPGSYLNLILSKWKRSLRYGNDYYKLTEPSAYFAAYDGYILRLLDSPICSVRLAVLSEDADVALGFSVSRGSVLDYVYVHQHQRRLGIATHLVPADIDTVTHLTRTALTIWSNKHPEWKFNPFA